MRVDMHDLEQIETPRLTLRPVQLKDIDTIHTSVVRSQSALQTWLAWSHDTRRTATQTFVEEGIRSWSSNVPPFNMLMEHTSTGAFIGMTGYTDQTSLDQGIYDIGYWCDIDQQGRGYITEAAHALTHAAFKNHDAHTVVIRVASGNLKSQAIPKRLNFIKTHEQPSISLPHATDYVYALNDIQHLPALRI